MGTLSGKDETGKMKDEGEVFVVKLMKSGLKVNYSSLNEHIRQRGTHC
jgi:hypothetical protein